MIMAVGGIRLDHWLELWRDNDYDVSDIGWGGAFHLTAHALVTEMVCRLEEAEFQHQIRAVQLQDPVFVLGHWRSGTTFLYRFLSQDPQFAFPTTLQVFNPHTFLTLEGHSRRWWGRGLRRLYSEWLRRSWGRHMQDFVNLGRAPDEASQEDEFALMAFGLSPFMALIFPRRKAYYDQFLTLGLLSQGQRERWISRWLNFLKKVSLLNPGRRLILKSPAHTGRIEIIREVFPQARFVHISRDPYRIFKSSLVKLNSWTSESIEVNQQTEDTVLSGHDRLYEAYFQDRKGLEPGRLHQIRYEDLVEQPLDELRKLYQALDLEGFENAEPHFLEQLKQTESHHTGSYPDLSQDQKDRVYSRWSRYFEAFGYPR
jgi:omega-hydroxy-beta-dihydromenaquinone-9 sulfotransferase